MAVMRLNFFSRELGMYTNITAVLPSFDQGYDVGRPLPEIYAPEEKFPVLWLMHGGSGDDADYLNWTNIARYAVEYNCAVICPSDYNAAYNDYPRGAKYYKYITEELRAFIFSRFPSLSDRREDNFVGGLSMGSGGAMKIAIDRCDEYSHALIMSGGNLSKPKPQAAAGLTGGHSVFREKMIDAGWAMPKQPGDLPRLNLSELLEEKLAKGCKMPKFLLACGESDSIAYDGFLNGKAYLAELGCDHIAYSLPGYKHEWDFWELILRKAFAEWLPVRKKTATELITSVWQASENASDALKK